MSDVVQQTQQEFWRPPSPVVAEEIVFSEARPALAVTCKRCATEFLPGARFCHSCGGRRTEALSAATERDAAALAGLWQNSVLRFNSGLTALADTCRTSFKVPGWLHYLHFHEVKSRIGLSTASLIAFLIGLGCVAGALLVGLLNARTLVDWQAIQFYRAEWLLGATACFVGGILLKKPDSNRRN